MEVKKIKIILVAIILNASMLFAQSPDKISYQAVIRSSPDEVLSNQSIGMQISILQGSASGLEVYVETQKPTTNSSGLISVEIGSGTSSDDFSAIDWSNGPYFIKTETDPAGNSNYTITGTSELLSVPFALHAKKADNVFSGNYSDLNNAPTTITIAQADAIVNNTQAIKDSAAQIRGDIPNTSSFLTKPVIADANDLISYDGTNWVAKNAVVASVGGNQAQNNMQPWLAVNYIIAFAGIYPSRNSISDPTIGEITIFAGNFAPLYWSFCNGQLLSISTNTALFSVLGTNYGGDGRTTFALPDLRGRTPVHVGTGTGLSIKSLGQIGGSETNVMTIEQMPIHTHTITYD